MLQIRFLIVFFATIVASDFSSAQTLVFQPSIEASINSATSDLISVLDGATAPTVLAQPEAAAYSFSPAPAIPKNAVVDETETLNLGPSTVSLDSYQANNQAYSPSRDGLPTLEQRRQLRAMPIEQRPNRLFHFYGNTVRRRMGR